MIFKHVVSVSGGKDSLATLLIALERCQRENIVPIWRDVAGYEGVYEVSNDGMVRRVGRSKPLKPYMRPGKYGAVVLCLNGTSKTHLIHRLVAEAFLKKPEDCDEVNHLNGDKHCNRIENLEWSNRSANNLHAYRELGRAPVKSMTGCRGSDHPNSKPVKAVCVATGEIRRFESTRLAADAGFCQSAVARCARLGAGSHKGWEWVYV